MGSDEETEAGEVKELAQHQVRVVSRLANVVSKKMPFGL